MDMTAKVIKLKSGLSQFLHNCSKRRLGAEKELSYQLRCLECGAATTPVPSCECRGKFDYIAPSELAEWAVKTYPEKSDRVIGEEFGISDRTVNRARASTATNDAVEKRTGRDGRTRRMPQRQSKPPGVKQAQRSINLHPEVWEQLKAQCTVSGVSVAERIGQLLTATIDPEIDPNALPKTAQDKLAAAIRQHRRKLDSEYDQRRMKEIADHIKRIMPTLQQEKNDAYERERTYREFMQKQKKIMTVADFMFVLSCLHPDSRASVSEQRLTRAFQLFEPKKFAITGEK